MKDDTDHADPVRRDVLKKAVFVAPVIFTLPVTPSFAQKASGLYPPPPTKTIPIPSPLPPKIPLPPPTK